MAETDIYIRDLIWTFSIPFVFTVFLLILFLTDSFKDFRRKIFASGMSKFETLFNQRTADVKKILFEDLNDLVSNVTELRNRGLIRILEIGVGSGANLQYYPQQCRLVVVDPNIYFKQYFMENMDKFPDIHLEKFVLSSGENLRKVATGSVDVVVTTIVLCCVENVQRVLKEIKRVLVPGGRYYFLEHVLDYQKTRRHTLQTIVNKTGIWPWLYDGCMFQDVDVEIAKAGFSMVEQKRFRIDSSGSRILYMLEPHVVGIATK